MATKTKTTSDDAVYRVFYIPKAIRAAAKAARLASGTETMAQQIETILETHLDNLVASLGTLGVSAPKQAGPVRMPLNERLLKRLREASARSGLAQGQLVIACTVLATSKSRRKGGKS